MDLIILLIVVLVLLLIIIFLAIQFFNIIFRGYAPFISTNRQVIAKILAEINLEKNSKVYELGCGRAGFLHAVCDKFPSIKAIGIDNDPWAYLLARIQAAVLGKKIKIVRQNLFKVNLSEADLIYCYLNPATMVKLKDKFKKECKRGARIISYLFSLPQTQTDKIIEIDRNKIYFYTIK